MSTLQNNKIFIIYECCFVLEMATPAKVHEKPKRGELKIKRKEGQQMLPGISSMQWLIRCHDSA